MADEKTEGGVSIANYETTTGIELSRQTPEELGRSLVSAVSDLQKGWSNGSANFLETVGDGTLWNHRVGESVVMGQPDFQFQYDHQACVRFIEGVLKGVRENTERLPEVPGSRF